MAGTAYPFVASYLRGLLDRDSQILEIGCGGKQYKPLLPGQYYGLDLPSSPYLEEPPDFACSAEAIPCEDARFDLVFGVATFLIIPDVIRAFSECHRILKQGGSLVIFDYRTHVCRRLQDADPNHKHVWDFHEMKHRLARVGFRPYNIREITWHVLPIARRIVHVLGRKTPWLVVEATK